MAKRAKEVEKPTIERTVYVPAWGYNFLVRRSEREPWRNVKSDLSALLERALREEMQTEGQPAAP